MKLLRYGEFYGNRDVDTNREVLMESGTSANIALNDNRGQMIKIGVNFFKSGRGKNAIGARSPFFAPAFISLYIDKEFNQMPLLR